MKYGLDSTRRFTRFDHLGETAVEFVLFRSPDSPITGVPGKPDVGLLGVGSPDHPILFPSPSRVSHLIPVIPDWRRVAKTAFQWGPGHARCSRGWAEIGVGVQGLLRLNADC